LQKTLLLGARVVRIGLLNPARLSHVLGSALAASTEVANARRLGCDVCQSNLLKRGDAEVVFGQIL